MLTCSKKYPGYFLCPSYNISYESVWFQNQSHIHVYINATYSSIVIYPFYSMPIKQFRDNSTLLFHFGLLFYKEYSDWMGRNLWALGCLRNTKVHQIKPTFWYVLCLGIRNPYLSLKLHLGEFPSLASTFCKFKMLKIDTF